MSDRKFQGYVHVRQDSGQCMFTLRANLASTKIKAAVKSATGVAFPNRGLCEVSEGCTMAWMSPDELLIIIDYKNVSKIISNLNKILTGTHSLVVDVSDARSVFSLDGTAIRDVLSKGSPANLSTDALPVGEVRRTRIAQLAVAFWFTDEMNCQLICFRSVGGYIMDWLKNASETGSEVNFH